MSLFDASVDLNPHQIEAALFALASPISKGVILADEVGLGKTIEAGIVLCQLWAERKRRLLVLCPASLRKQWAMELYEKFNLPAEVVDARVQREYAKRGEGTPLTHKKPLVMSFNYANRLRDELKMIPWDMVVIDEAHKLRNAYRPSNKIGRGIRWATEDCRKVLLTATPLQNSLLELYGLSTLIDEHLFGDVNAFRSQYVNAGGDLGMLRQRLTHFCKRTLRNQVTEYVQYTERKPITSPFTPTEEEQHLYVDVSAFLQREDSYAIPYRQRHLTILILHKLLASSSHAIAGTLERLRDRLIAVREGAQPALDFTENLVEEEEIEDDILDDILAEDDEPKNTNTDDTINLDKLNEEIHELDRLANWAKGIGVDTKTRSLVKALEIGFGRMEEMGAARKALIFTESRRTQDYLKQFLEANGYAGQVIAFNGTNSGPEAKAIYERWMETNRDSGRVTGSRPIDIRTALIEHFRDHVSIMVATEAAAEGVNLQFCSLVVNYDLPWNPQRIEQRIGRCHRYGQKHDVVVINFINKRNDADRRVFELLRDKFNLFDGVFGASDDVLGTVESGVDFEKRILAIYQECRTAGEIETAFQQLQAEMDEKIKTRIADTRKILFEHFDEDVHERLRLRLEDAKAQLDRVGKRFWTLTRFMLVDRARFDEDELAFDLESPPASAIPKGRYFLVSKSRPKLEDNGSSNPHGYYLYRLSHPLGEHVLSEAKSLETPSTAICFDITSHPTRIAVVEALKGRSGHLTLTRLVIDTFEREAYLLFSGFDDAGKTVDQETFEKLFNCTASVEGPTEPPKTVLERLKAESERHIKATLNKSLEANSAHFKQAQERLEKWADDMVLSAEKSLKDTKEQIKALRREARQATTLEEQHEIQQRIRKMEKKQQRQRQDIFKAEDEIMEKRDALIEGLERRLAQKTETKTLFTIRWTVI